VVNSSLAFSQDKESYFPTNRSTATIDLLRKKIDVTTLSVKRWQPNAMCVNDEHNANEKEMLLLATFLPHYT
jgi:hypothetical protein